jgi:hypothetical protein
MPSIIAKAPQDRKGQGLSYNDFWTLTTRKHWGFLIFLPEKSQKCSRIGKVGLTPMSQAPPPAKLE